MSTSVYGNSTVFAIEEMNMPPEGFTTVTISEDTAAKLAEIVATQEFESIAEAIDYATNLARDQDRLSDAELARLL